MAVPNPLLFLGRKVLVGAPQWSKFGGSGAKSGGSCECNIAELTIPLSRKLIFEMPFNKNLFSNYVVYKSVYVNMFEKLQSFSKRKKAHMVTASSPFTIIQQKALHRHVLHVFRV
jgi:hypothetical protein